MELLRDMALFVEVAKMRSIKLAAESLGIPGSTLSRRISTLEKSLGLRLLHRTTRRIDLTEAGEIYFAQCRQIIGAANLAHEQLRDRADKPRGRLRLSLPVDFTTLFLAPLIAEFAAAYPDITFDLQLSERWIELAQEGVDLAVRLGLQPDSAMTARHIADVRYSLYAAPEYIRSAGSPRHPAQLADHSCIRMVCPHWSEAWTFLSDAETAQVTVKERIAVNNIALVRKFALLGLGIAPLDDLLVAEEVSAGRLARVLPDWHFHPVPVFALTPDRMLPAKTRAFVEFLVARLKAAPDRATSPAWAPASISTSPEGLP